MRNPPAAVTFSVVLLALLVVGGLFSAIAAVAPRIAVSAAGGLLAICALVMWATREG